MKKRLFLLVIPFLLVACKTKQEGKSDLLTIRLEDKIENPVELLASACFSAIEYLPLETSDSAIVGASPFFKFYKDKIIVLSKNSQCQAFDRHTGKYIGPIGMIDKGPRGYDKSLGAWINDETGEVFFKRGDGYVIYSSDGAFLGEVKIPATVKTAGSIAGCSYLDKENLLVYTNNILGTAPQLLACINRQDSILKQFPYQQFSDTVGMNEVASITVISAERALEIYGAKAIGGAMTMKTSNSEIGATFFPGEEPFWHREGNNYFKEDFNDTVFTVTAEQMIPRMIFDLGKYHWDFKDRFRLNMGKEHSIISRMVEGERYLFFSCFEGTGFYDKESGEAGVSKSFQLVDDLEHFMPLDIFTATPDGAFVCWLQPLKIQQWFEENPDQLAGMSPEVMKLKALSEESNPVLVFMKSK